MCFVTVLVNCLLNAFAICVGEVLQIVMYGSSIFSRIFAITERSEMGLYDVPMFMSLFGFGIGMMFASFHV